jgi:hypothetical protein
MHAASAVILAFPRRVPSAASDELELLPEHRLTSEAAAPSRARAPAAEVARPMVAWASNMLLAIPFFLSPRGGTAGDALEVALAILVFTAAAWAAPQLGVALERRRWPENLSDPPVLLALGALAGGLALGPAVAILVLLFGLLELARSRLSLPGRLGLAVAAAGHLLRVEAGAAVLGLELAPEMRLALLLLSLFLPLASSPRQRGARPSLDRDFVLLTLLVGTAVLYSAALTGDPWLQRAAGVSPLLSVPPLMLGLLRCWHLGQSGRLGSDRPDPWTFAAAAAWAGVLALTVAHPNL